ncbi:MAG: GIY-YIG nuclease family protein [Chloroflexi bacterium]|nr:GIY-YIG nuclease family protein [Chloroflexota bacterium]
MTTNNNSTVEEQPIETGEGYIYIIENEAFETPVVKIGKAKNLSQRINTLNTGVPLPFTCPKASKVEDMSFVEKFLHQTFHHAKGPWRGEFFQVEAWRVAAVLELLEVEDATELAPKPTKDEVDSIDTANQRRNRRFTFEMVKIDAGANLTLAADEEIIVRVADNKNKVEHEGNEYTISRLAQELNGLAYGVQGSKYWMYEGETLQERRERLEAGTQENVDAE